MGAGSEYPFPGWKYEEELVILLLDDEEDEEEDEEDGEVMWTGCFVRAEGTEGGGPGEEKEVKDGDNEGE